MEYKKYDCTSFNIHTIKTDKFKTTRMEIIFSSEVEKDKMPSYTFLSDILTDSSKKYPRRRDIAIRLEELYRAAFFGVTNKAGNLFTTSFILEFINPNYIDEKDYITNVLSFPFEVLNNPLVINKEFDITNFNIVKKRLLEEAESVKESSDKLAIINALNKMDESSPSSYRVIGTKSQIEKITPASLYNDYENLFKHFNCDIFIIGNINMEEAVKIIKAKFVNHYIKIKKVNLLVHNNLRKKPLVVNEKSSFVQSTLVMIYNINNLNKEEKDIAFHVFNYILGSGGISAKLYQKLRCENSLCYSVRSLYLKHDELLIIEVSLDKNNVLLAEKLIKNCLKEMIQGKYSEEEVNDAKKNLIVSLKMCKDSNISLLNNYIFNYYDDLPLIDERINKIENISKEELLKCGKSLSLNTIYIQEAGDNSEGN